MAWYGSEQGADDRRALARYVVLAGILTFWLTAISHPSQAFELFGRSIFGSDQEEEAETGVPDPTPYETTFAVNQVPDQPDEGLQGRLQDASLLLNGEENPPSGFVGVLSRAQSDRTRLLAALYEEGRFGGTVLVTVAGDPIDGIAPDPDRRFEGPVPVSVTIDPGPLFRFGEVSIPSNDGSTEAPDAFGLVSGAPAESSRILSAEGQIVRTLQERGYPFAAVGGRDIVADHETARLDVTIRAEPGPIATIGPVSVEGAEKVKPDFIIRHANLPVGRTYDPRILEEAATRLRRLGLFDRVTVAADSSIGTDGDVPILITVAEGKMRVIGAGLTVDSEDGLGVEAFWRHRNLLGGAEEFGVEGSIGRIGHVTALDELEYRASLVFAKPGVLGPASRFESRASLAFEDSDAFIRRSASVEAGLRYEIDDRQSVRGRILVERSEIEDAFGEEDHILVGVPLEYIRDARDDRLDPSTGFRTLLFVEPFHDFEGADSFVRLGASVAVYQAVDQAKRFVLAARVAGATILGADAPDVPANLRYFAGGANSVRGYGFQQAGPASADGTPTGGATRVETSVEARIRVTEAIAVVPFFDAGGIFDTSATEFGDNLQFGAGLGVRYNTAIGPLRLDVGVPINPGRGDDEFGVYLGLGHAF
ncbi:MAG: autotransporter assembly complex family protein [Pseudomonadota bacterium]